jgi:acyl-CoA dehydrogenase
MFLDPAVQDRVLRVRRIATDIAAAHADDVDRQARFPTEAFAALKQERMLGLLVPQAYGGLAVGMLELSAMCEALGQACASTGLAFAMHHIQVASIARHCGSSQFFADYLRLVVQEQRLIASVTSEVGIGGDMRSSSAGVERHGAEFRVEKAASTLSYGAQADDLLLTAKSKPDAPANDQVLVLLKKGDFSLEKTGTWDTMGLRGTCSPSFKVRAQGSQDQILGHPFGDIATQTMVPVSHVLWANVWLGIASSAVSRARAFVRQQARAKPGQTPSQALRLAEVSMKLQTLRATVHDVATECETLMRGPALESLSSHSFGLKMNNLKLAGSSLVVDIVQQSLIICGIGGYKNDSPYSLGRQLRDALSAVLQVSNDRLLSTNASLLLVLKDS